ncbi:MAG TPA: Flp family type IVb pilin [Pseudolysinimonas sp.]|nr:Flp family type IVb pilin [Pseudolysinimonas sp.]
MNSLGETMFNALLTRFGVALHTTLTDVKNDEEGATAVEYGLIVGLIAVVIIGAVVTLGGLLNGFFEDINTQLGGAS